MDRRTYIIQFPESSTENVPEERMVYPDPEIERDVFVSQATQFQSEMFGAPGMNQFEDLLSSMRQQHGNVPPNANMGGFGAFAQFGNSDGGPDMNAFFTNLNTEDSPKVPETRLQRFLKTKIHIGILSIFTYLFITMAPFHCNVFLLFLIWEITEIFLLRQHENNPNGMVNMLFLLAGTSPNKINMLLKWVQLLNKVLRDVAIFIFFFVITHMCFMSWNGMTIIPIVKESLVVKKILSEIPATYDISDEDVFEHFDL